MASSSNNQVPIREVENAPSMPDGSNTNGIIPAITNIAATFDLGCRLDLHHVALYARNVEYHRGKTSVVMRIKNPRATALIFASGKVDLKGTNSEVLSKHAAKKFARIIQKLGYKVDFGSFRIHNVSGLCDVEFPMVLESLAAYLGTGIGADSSGVIRGGGNSYEPELFPAFTWRMTEPAVVLMVFARGKVVFTGAKNREDLLMSFERAFPVLRAFKRINFGQALDA